MDSFNNFDFSKYMPNPLTKANQQTQNAIDSMEEKHKRDEEARQAALKTERNTKHTAEEVSRLNSQVSKLSADLKEERRIRKDEIALVRQEQNIYRIEDSISETKSNIGNDIASLFSFIVLTFVFFYENLNLTKWTTGILIIIIVLYHAICLFRHCQKICKLKLLLNGLQKGEHNA